MKAGMYSLSGLDGVSQDDITRSIRPLDSRSGTIFSVCITVHEFRFRNWPAWKVSQCVTSTGSFRCDEPKCAVLFRTPAAFARPLCSLESKY